MLAQPSQTQIKYSFQYDQNARKYTCSHSNNSMQLKYSFQYDQNARKYSCSHSNNSTIAMKHHNTAFYSDLRKHFMTTPTDKPE